MNKTCIFFLYLAALGSFLYNEISLYILWPIVFLLSKVKTKDIFRCEILKSYSFLWIFFIISYCFAINPEAAFRELKMMLGVVLAVFSFCGLSKNERNIPFLYGSFIIFYIGMIIFVQQSGLMIGFNYQSDRMNLDNLNANSFGYYTFYLTSSIFIIGEITENRIFSRILRVMFLLTIPLTGIIAILTASRQVLIIQVPLILACIYIRYLMYASNKQRTFVLLLFFIIALVSFDSMYDVFNNSLLSKRFGIESEDDERTILLTKAIEVGSENFIIGVGPGCFKTYLGQFSHNTYIELFANYGIFAALYYVYILLHFIIVQWRNYRKYKDKMYLTFVVVGVIFMFDNLFYVFYAQIWLMAFFFILSMHSQHYSIKFVGRKD